MTPEDNQRGLFSVTRKRFLSTFDTWSTIEFWGEEVDSLRLPLPSERALARRLLQPVAALWAGTLLWFRSLRYEVVITDSSLAVSIFGLWLRLFPFRRPRHLLLEALWQYPPSGPAGLMKSLQLRAAVTRWTRVVVYARQERERFSQCFRIPVDRFVFIPYHSTLHRYRPAEPAPPAAEQYLFAGGESLRDYRTLIDAVRGLKLRVFIALRDPALLNGIEIPSHVTITRTDHFGFLELMRGAAINVVPLASGTLRSAGHQTYLNAMALGTVTVVTDQLGAPDYIRNWVDGVIVPSADVAALRAALERVIGDPELAATIRRNAVEAGKRFTTERILKLYLRFSESERFTDPGCTEAEP